MLLRFSIENWMCYRDQATISMQATRERKHKEHVSKIGKLSLLPIAAIYGRNASGKSSFFFALNFVKQLIIKGVQPNAMLGIDTFRLGDTDKPVRFEIEILVDETIYIYSFTATQTAIIEEKLILKSGKKEKTLYHRLNGELDVDPSLKDNQWLKFAFQATLENQLFLTNSVSQKLDAFKVVYDWFKDSLELLAVDSRFELFEQFLEEENPLYTSMNTKLFQLGTGIHRLAGEPIAFENLPLPEHMKIKIMNELPEGKTIRVLSRQTDERFIVMRKEGELIIQKFVAFHLNGEGKEVKIDISRESDGTQRLIDLLPGLMDLSAEGSKKVYFIDELDLSLDPLLVKRLLKEFLKTCSSKSRSQLLFTTHNPLLMEEDLLRRDELWVTERRADGASRLVGFSAYKQEYRG